MIYRLPIGLLIAAALIPHYAVPYMKWVGNSGLLSFGGALGQLSPALAGQLGAQVWIPAAGLMLAVGAGLMVATLLVHGAILLYSALSSVFRMSVMFRKGL